ncbi:MAG TPA: SGNH/GDSL hydrolase N-terminal domain-containing protein [Flavihumibacter sp.]
MLLVGMVDISAQENTIKWWDPVKEGYRLEGQGWAEGLEHPYDRFPAFAKNDLREVVWFKSQQSTGLLVKFRTDASSIHVRYKVKDVLAFEHMPATGVFQSLLGHNEKSYDSEGYRQLLMRAANWTAKRR